MTYEKLVKGIVDQMQIIIGSVAVTQANKVKGLKINDGVHIHGDSAKVISRLITNHQKIIGDVALTIAAKGAKPILEKNPKLKIPDKLKR